MTEQVLQIYPVLKGQKLDGKNAIPPWTTNASVAQPTTNHFDDLIDFGQNDPAPSQMPALDARHNSTAEIQSLLSSTGTPAPTGPLIDFQDDLKKELPQSLKRQNTEGSVDDFFDA